MKKISTAAAKRAIEFSKYARVRTGDHCPNSGWWTPEGDPETTLFVSEGSLMPAHNGVAVSWTPAVQSPPFQTPEIRAPEGKADTRAS